MPPSTPAWTSEEESLIIKHRSHEPPTKWSDITAFVNKLQPGGRSLSAIKSRYLRTLKVEKGPGEVESEMLAQAVAEVEGSEKWDCVAYRYRKIREGKGVQEETRDISKAVAKKWWVKVGKGKGGGEGGSGPIAKGKAGKRLCGGEEEGDDSENEHEKGKRVNLEVKEEGGLEPED